MIQRLRVTRKGFSIIEMLLYLLISSSIMALLFHMTITILSFPCKGAGSAILTQATVYSLMVRDIYYAPSQEDRWIQQDNHTIAWRTGEGQSNKDSPYTGFMFEDDAILRLHGDWDSTHHQWHSHAKNVIAYGISAGNFRLDKRESIMHNIHVSFIKHGRHIAYDLCLPNRYYR